MIDKRFVIHEWLGRHSLIGLKLVKSDRLYVLESGLTYFQYHKLAVTYYRWHILIYEWPSGKGLHSESFTKYADAAEYLQKCISCSIQ